MPTYCLSSCLAFNRPSKTTNGSTLLIFWAWLLCDNQLANWAVPVLKMNKPIETNHPFWKLKQPWQYVCLYLLVAIAVHKPCCPLFMGQLVQGPPAAFWENVCAKRKNQSSSTPSTLPKSAGSEPSHRCNRLLLPRVYECVQVRGCKWQQLTSFLPPAHCQSDEQRE